MHTFHCGACRSSCNNDGAFMKPDERANLPKPKSVGGGANATTAYLVNYTSRKFGPLYVFTAIKLSKKI